MRGAAKTTACLRHGKISFNSVGHHWHDLGVKNRNPLWGVVAVSHLGWWWWDTGRVRLREQP